jgi:hypothetical protein
MVGGLDLVHASDEIDGGSHQGEAEATSKPGDDGAVGFSSVVTNEGYQAFVNCFHMVCSGLW